MIEQLLSLYDKGGPVIAILVVLSILTLSTILHKLWAYFSTGLGRHARIREAIHLWKNNHRQPAINLLKNGKSPASKAVLHTMQGLAQAPDKPDLIREDIDRVAGEELAKARQGIRLLEMIAQTAPLLGLFGTILGMIEAFQALQSAGANIDPSALAGGIWVALLTTAAGLALAIPTTMIVTWFEGMVEAETQAIESMATALLTEEITADTRSSNARLPSEFAPHHAHS